MDDVRSARIAGVLYLIIIVCAGFAEGAVRSSLIVPDDAVATASNITGDLTLYRVGYVADIIAFACDVGVSVLLFVLLRSTAPTLALTAMAFRLIAHPAIATVNLLNMAAPWFILQQGSSVEHASLVATFTQLHDLGYGIAGTFFGVHCILLGYLLHLSDRFPSWIGWTLVVAGILYIIDGTGTVLFPSITEALAVLVMIVAVISELSLCLWLLIRGVR
jgi:hypothetical protein